MLLVPAIPLTACGASSGNSTAPVAQKAVVRTAAGCPHRNAAAGTVRYSDWQFPDTLNPFQTTSAASFETINGQQESLFTYDQKAALIPQMATTIPTVGNGGVKGGGRTIVIDLKHGMHWSDGAQVTSRDVLFGWKIGMDKATGPYCAGSCDQISRIDTPDRYTASIHLKGVFAPAVPTAMPPLWPVAWKGAWNGDAHVAAVKLGQDSSFNFEGPNFPTNGAYQVTTFSKDDRIVLQPMKYYSDMACGGFIKNLIFAFYSSKPSMIAAAADNGTDVTQDYTTADLKELNRHSSAYTVYSTPGFEFEHLEFNVNRFVNGRPNPLFDGNVRLALALSLDKIGLIRSALGIGATAAKDIASWTPWVNTPKLVQPFVDRKVSGQWDPIAGAYVAPGTTAALKDAGTLLARTPWKGGFPLSVSTTTGNPVRNAQLGVIQNNWARIGVQVIPNLVPSSKLFGSWATGGPLSHGAFQVAMLASQGSAEPDTFKYEVQSRYIDRTQSVHSAINQNYSGISDAILNHAFEAAAHTFTVSVRTRYYHIIQERLNQKAYWIGLYFRPSIATADRNVVNFSNNPTSAGPTWNVFAWRGRSAS